MTAFDDGLWTRLVDEHGADRVALGAVAPQPSRRPLVFGLSGLGAVSAVGAAIAVLSLSGGASNAFAGWTPRPTRATSAQVSAANAYCNANVPTPGLPRQLTDTRGPFTVEVFANDTENDFCVVGPSFASASGFITSSPVQVPAGQLLLWSEHTFSESGQPYGALIARASDGVSAATLTLDDGSVVTATVQNGWVAAWWPGSHRATSAQLTTPTGTRTQTFPPGPCGLHNCSGATHGGSKDGGPGGD